MEREVFDNGAVLVSLNRRNDLTGRLVIGSRLGKVHEKKDGIAHLLEHSILSSDTKGKSYDQIAESMDMLGSYENGITTYDSIRIYGYASANRFKKFSDLLLSLSLSPRFKGDAIKNEKSIILNELKGNLDDPENNSIDLFMQGMFKKSPLRTSTIDELKALRRISPKDVKMSMKDYFAPNNVVVGLFGKFSGKVYESTRSMMRELDGPEYKAPSLLREDKKPYRHKTIGRKEGLRQVYIKAGVKTMDLEHPDTPTLEIISKLLTSGDSSRLYRELRLKRGLVYSVKSDNRAGREYGFFYIRTRTESHDTRQVLSIIGNELDKLMAKKISETELKKAKNIVIGERNAQYDKPLEGSLRLVNDEILLGDFTRLKAKLQNLKKVSVDDVKRVSKEYLSEDHFSISTLRPERSKHDK